MALQLRKAERKKAKLKLGMAAPSGGGKTLGALLIAYGMMKAKYPNLPESEIWNKIAVVDTENGSGELYANTNKVETKIGEYFTIPLEPPYTPQKYSEAIKLCHNEGIEVCILDSTTHAWAGAGGLLEQQGNIAKRSGNSYTAWRDVTPLHNQFIDTMLQTDIHIIATMRSKTEYVVEKNEKGGTTVRKVGLAPVQRDGMEYEFTAFFDIDAEHNCYGSKDRTGIFDQQYFKITPETGMKLMQWLESGAEVVAQPQPKVEMTQPETAKEETVSQNEEMQGEQTEEVTFEELKKTTVEMCKQIGIKKVTPTINTILRKKLSETTEQDFEKVKELYAELVKLVG